MIESKPNLIISPVGDSSCHKYWIKDPQKDFDLMLIYYGKTQNKYKKDANYYLHREAGFKLENIRLAIDKFYDDVKKYKAVWLPDSDIVTDGKTINRLFQLFHEYNLDLAQPAIVGSINHPFTKPNRECILRYVNFIEMMCPIFKIDILLKILDTFMLNKSGWGIDYLWSEIFKNNKMAIIDSIPVFHKKRFTDNINKPYYQNLAKIGIDAGAELKKILTQYNISGVFTELERIKKPNLPQPYSFLHFSFLEIRAIPSAIFSLIKRLTNLYRKRGLKGVIEKIFSFRKSDGSSSNNTIITK